MKTKNILIFCLLLVILISSVNAKIITQEELETYNNTKIKELIINNFGFVDLEYVPDVEQFVFSYKTLGLSRYNYHYKIVNVGLTGYLDINDWLYCKDLYNFNVCKTNLINNYGTYTINNITKPTVFEQLKQHANYNYNLIIDYRDNPYIDYTENIDGDGTVEI